MSLPGIIAYGAHVPVHRLDAAGVRAAHGHGRSSGTRAVACFDEDSTTMGFEAGRRALRAATGEPVAVYFATTSPAYLEKTNAAAIHAALNLSQSTSAIDMVGSLRSGTGALRAALNSPEPVLAVMSDIRVGRPGGVEEISGGDAAAAFLLSGNAKNPVAEFLGGAAATGEYLDRWRTPGEAFSQHWEENFGATLAAELAPVVLNEALDDAGVTTSDVDQAIVVAANPRAANAVTRVLGLPREVLVDDLTERTGTAGAAHSGLRLAHALDRAESGRLIVLISVADGVEAQVFRTTRALLAHQDATQGVEQQVADVRASVPYARYLGWRGVIDLEAPRKAAPAPHTAPVAHRRRGWKFGMEASRCTKCGTRQLPPQRICHSCKAVDAMEVERVRDVGGRLVAHTIDRLAWSPSPPAVFGIVDLDGGGRAELELTDLAESDLVPGRRMELTFRVLYTRDGKRNYFWKARPSMEEN